MAPKERILVTLGAVQIRQGPRSAVLREGQFVDVDADTWEVRAGHRPAGFVRLSGHWGEELGGCGIFRVTNEEHPVDSGDPVAYGKTTSVDSHYHDCDEYWIVLEGAGTVFVGERHFGVGSGDCVTIGMGHHHDMPLVDSPVKAVYFETTLEGEKRFGHLWNHTHGPAAPKLGRV
jgi:mannose-6-phosphate isomerase-like protein (cupin superfamily)